MDTLRSRSEIPPSQLYGDAILPDRVRRLFNSLWYARALLEDERVHTVVFTARHGGGWQVKASLTLEEHT